jgi:hypothetical protein
MTAYNASKMLAGTQPKMLPSAGGVNVLSTIALTTALAVNDTINFVQLASDAADNPSGFGPTILDVTLDSDKLDTNGAPTISWNVGDATSANRYFSSGTAGGQIGRTGGYVIPSNPAVLGFQPFASSFTVYPTPSLQLYTILLTVVAAAATWQNGTIRLLVGFTYDP